ncbi:Sec14p-like phosphatidylinositol transfer family protein [Klebsormidium nitens]|uniref:Sec14p-like phosphatidylinositol transfer family protein n=1 Tax=Klebsormidium nitens TaxID=105231 RepID=A0A1Y1IE31_KLENI|nr:Sec14p-like phosphatidylinositol transfer family protein [Klebsormidium nitens]|eukprot:GAQ88853.1 Sec14p-like phosphatidylinositol transfer family protein [Klebsormidium nitens]
MATSTFSCPDLTDTQSVNLEAMRSKLATLDEAFQASFEVLAQGEPDRSLMRFLWAREWHVDKAFSMLVDCLKWRRKYGTDTILQRPLEEAKMRAIRNGFHVGMSGYDKQGHPVIFVKVGPSKCGGATVDDYVKAHVQFSEWRDRVLCAEASKRCGRPITTTTRILDCTGLTLGHLANLNLLNAMSKIDEFNYPEKANAYYLVNVPYVFTAIWKVVKPLLQPRTINRVKVLSGNGLDTLRQFIDEEHIPVFLRDPKSSVDCTSLDCSLHRRFWAYLQEQAAAAPPAARQEEAAAAAGHAHVETPKKRHHRFSLRKGPEEGKQAADSGAVAPEPSHGAH